MHKQRPIILDTRWDDKDISCKEVTVRFVFNKLIEHNRILGAHERREAFGLKDAGFNGHRSYCRVWQHRRKNEHETLKYFFILVPEKTRDSLKYKTKIKSIWKGSWKENGCSWIQYSNIQYQLDIRTSWTTYNNKLQMLKSLTRTISS